MVAKPYLWESGVRLEEHTKRKLKILRQYFARYLAVRCQYPQQARFRLAIVDGFCGAGRYSCGTPGSPLIFIEELRTAAETFNVKRAAEGMTPLDIECLLVFNDESPDAIEILKARAEPLLASVSTEVPKLHLHAAYLTKPFEHVYAEIKDTIHQGRYRSVLFNLDQHGHSDVNLETITDILGSFTSAEIFYTFAIKSLLAFLRKNNPMLVQKQLGFLGVKPEDLSPLEGFMSNQAWLGAAEQLVFSTFQAGAPYVSPFSIHNPEGWRYWLIHFANSYRARQEYNNVLHQNSSMQAHFGRSGLDMLSYDPSDDSGAIYLFDVSARKAAREQLSEDIPRLVTEFGDACPRFL
jgi:three-Cys-motif partner protein